MADLATSFEWDEMVNSTCIDYLNANGVSELFAQEMVDASARVNYGQVGLFFLSQETGCFTKVAIYSRMSARSTDWGAWCPWLLPVRSA